MLGIIGGSGLYALDELKIIKEHDIDTPFGKPSAPIVEGSAFIKSFVPAAPGRHHQFLPTEVNFPGEYLCLKKIGCMHDLECFGLQGLCKKKSSPAIWLWLHNISIIRAADGNHRFWWRRDRPYFHRAAHLPRAGTGVLKAAKISELRCIVTKPMPASKVRALAQKAESLFLRGPAGCDIVGMTNVPEAFLAREAQMGYVTLAIATDYDCWREDPDEHVNVRSGFCCLF